MNTDLNNARRKRGGPQPAKPLTERFWSSVVKDPNGCWIWIGAKGRKGYGRLHHVNGRSLMAHRISWEMHKGKIPDGVYVCHSCDNPPCVNPDHLWLGDNDSNMADMAQKGRRLRHKGEEASAGTDSLACPFCGGSKLKVMFYNRPCVICQTCDADGPGGELLKLNADITKASQEAWRLWNKRAAALCSLPEQQGQAEVIKAFRELHEQWLFAGHRSDMNSGMDALAAALGLDRLTLKPIATEEETK